MSEVPPPGPVRAFPRLQAPFPARWRQLHEEHAAVASGISLAGCLVRTLGVVPPPAGEVWLTIAFPAAALRLHGVAVWSEAGKGFGLKFTRLTPELRAHLAEQLRAAGLAQPNP
jgi:hypothetical protein